MLKVKIPKDETHGQSYDSSPKIEYLTVKPNGFELKDISLNVQKVQSYKEIKL